MPAFSLHWPRFLRSRRSRSRSIKPSQADACDDAPVASAGLCPSHALSFRPSSRLGSSEPDVNAASTVPPLSVPSQNPTGPLPLNRTPVDSGGQASASRPVTPISAVPPNPVSILTSRDSSVQLDIQVAPPSDDTHSAQAQQHLAPPPSPYVLTTSSQQSFRSEPQMPPTGLEQRPQYPGMFNKAHNLSATGNFIDGNVGSVTFNGTTSDHFMKELLKETIPGAASDSSARHPPPQCHPGTRLAILERCLHFIANCTGKQKIRWVVGSAGVGKSAIMQSVADSPNLPVICHASIFFSINGRNDGTKAIITLCYQLATKSGHYRELIEREVARDPSLLQSSMPVQFKKFIIEPFIHKPQSLNSTERILIIIDGLDECKNPRTQRELLRLISDFCIKYPSSPIVWLIASRPERHITSFFDEPNVKLSFEKEEIQVDSDEGRADVEQFLRAELNVIKASYSLGQHSQWPEEKDFWKLADAAGGLFAYAHTVIRYIDDSNVGNPVLQLSDVLKVIDNLPMTGISREEHPMALLDSLYARILSNVPDKVIVHTRKLIMALVSRWHGVLIGDKENFVVLCNWLAMTPDDAYAAVNQLQSLLRTPKRDQAHLESLQPFHKSFIDYVSDSSRSNFFTDMDYEVEQLKIECAFRVLNEAPNGIDFGDVDYEYFFGTLRRGPGTGDKISLTWPVGGCDENTRLKLYNLAIGEVALRLENGGPTFASEFCIRLLTTQFVRYRISLIYSLPQRVFDESRRHEFMRCGILKQMPLQAVPGIPKTGYHIALRFRRPARAVAPDGSTVLNVVEFPSYSSAIAVTSLSDPWNSSCLHEREGEWEEGKDQDWETVFGVYGMKHGECNFCYRRLKRQLRNWMIHSPDHTVTVLFTYAGDCCVELQFVDPDDGISEWTYYFWVKISQKKRKKYGSTV